MYSGLIRSGFRFRSLENAFAPDIEVIDTDRETFSTASAARNEKFLAVEIMFSVVSRDLLLSWRDTVIVKLMPDKGEIRKPHTLENTRFACIIIRH